MQHFGVILLNRPPSILKEVFYCVLWSEVSWRENSHYPSLHWQYVVSFQGCKNIVVGFILRDNELG